MHSTGMHIAHVPAMWLIQVHKAENQIQQHQQSITRRANFIYAGGVQQRGNDEFGPGTHILQFFSVHQVKMRQQRMRQQRQLCSPQLIWFSRKLKLETRNAWHWQIHYMQCDPVSWCRFGCTHWSWNHLQVTHEVDGSTTADDISYTNRATSHMDPMHLFTWWAWIQRLHSWWCSTGWTSPLKYLHTRPTSPFTTSTSPNWEELAHLGKWQRRHWSSEEWQTEQPTVSEVVWRYDYTQTLILWGGGGERGGSKQQLFHLCPLRSGEFWQDRGVMKPKEDTLLILNLLTEG